MEMRFLESHPFFKEQYEKLMGIIADADRCGTYMDFLEMKMFNVYPHMLRGARTEEEKAFLTECEREMVACYQRTLERNYARIQAHKEQGEMNHGPMDGWILTLDERGVPRKTTVIAINEKGYPTYADHCTDVRIRSELQNVWNRRYELRQWLDRSVNDLYELKAAALKLWEQGRLGMAGIPSPNYDTYGMTREQGDAQAWQNYVIESGMYRPTDYDQSLDSLLKSVDRCIDFYEKAISMVEA